MKQWEYMHIECNFIRVTNLNAIGKDGWELVHILNTQRDTFILYFKRETNQEVECAMDIPIKTILDDIDSGRVQATARVRCLLRDEMDWNGKEFISQISFKRRNFGKKSQTELRELIDQYNKRKD